MKHQFLLGKTKNLNNQELGNEFKKVGEKILFWFWFFSTWNIFCIKFQLRRLNKSDKLNFRHDPSSSSTPQGDKRIAMLKNNETIVKSDGWASY